jgi:hypothetical protein
MSNAIYGQQSTLSASDINLRTNIEDTIKQYPDWMFPILKRWSGSNFAKDVRSHKYEWSERDLRPVKTTVASETVTDSVTTFYVQTPGVFNIDDVLLAPAGEQMIVTAVAGGTLLTVIRGWGGTTPEAMVLGNDVSRIGVASRQGALVDNMVIQTPDDLFNYTQIFEDVVELSDTQHKSLIRGDEGSSKLIDRKQKELMEVLQLTLLVGRRYKDAANKRYSMGGLKYFIDTYAPENVVDFGGSGTWSTDEAIRAKFNAAVQLIADKGGEKPVIYLGYKAMEKLATMEATFVRTGKEVTSRGLPIPETFLSPLGPMDLVMIRERAGVLDDLIFFVDESSCGYKAMKGRGWFTEEKPFSGDGHIWQVLGEYTAKFDLPKLNVYMYNLGL